ncbi:MAG: hypothetical protein HYS52_01465 [Candidatus Wildermuthbacteria bacterium]|nr:hypothetical protein [Candidatus Wildermuthbacteria bacterium]
MKRFSLSTILGLALGILLVSSAVLGFSPPTSTPPGGNVSPPVTTDTAQTITGLKTFNPSGLFPFSVDASKTGIVASLNSDKLDSYNASDLLAQASGKTVYYQRCAWSNEVSQQACGGGFSSGTTSCIPSACAAGHTDLGNGCVATGGFGYGYVGGSWCGTAGPEYRFYKSGYCERVCLIP